GSWGGAAGGAGAAGVLAARGIPAVVFEQNPRPFGKIEDGLPRWHVKLRKKEYETINARLERPGVYFVPNTKIGRDVGFDELANQGGFSAGVLAPRARRGRLRRAGEPVGLLGGRARARGLARPAAAGRGCGRVRRQGSRLPELVHL